MHRAIGLSLAVALASPAVLVAGQVYGTIVVEGQPLKGASVRIACAGADPVTGTTAGDGSYRLNVPQQGQCTFAITSEDGQPSASVFSSPNPALYNFELVKAGGKLELRRK